jgi:hypothetical protein
MDILTARNKIMAAAQRSKPGSNLQYAAAYAVHLSHHLPPEDLHMQALYTLSNLQHWRGEEAREVKAFLKTL